MDNDEIRILAVDDDVRNLRSLEAVLAGSGASLITSRSGEEALRHTREHEFAAVLMDVQMPGMDGIETAGLIRAHGRSRSTPIIFLTAHDHMDEQVLRAYSVGAVDFLFKPLVPEILQSKIAVFIELHKKTLEIKRQEAALREAERRELERELTAERARWEELRLRDELDHERRAFAERERQAVTLNSIGDAVIATNPEGCVALLNPSAEALVGCPERDALGVPVDDILQLLDATTRTRRSLGERESNVTADTILVRRDGTERIVTESVAPVRHRSGERIGTVVVLRDVTVQRRMEHDLQNEQRMETVGLLAGGIAHDFNNLLAMIMASSTLARKNLPAGTQAERLLGEIEEACNRATALTRQLLTFARGGAPIREHCSLERLVHDCVSFSLRGSSTTCTYDIGRDLWTADVDPGQISQLLGNLVLNARDAMGDSGHLDVRIRNHQVAATHPGPLGPGGYLEVQLADTGSGIASENLDRIFDPYFTTKPDGTGLGLSSAYSIARRHDGLLRVESVPGQGSTFILYLPAAAAGHASPQAPSSEPSPTSRNARVLLMDDEEWLRTIVAECLVEMGHRVASTSNGGSAVDLYRQAMADGDPFDLVILDLTIRGGMGGVEALEALKALDPDVRAVASSGYADDPAMANYREHGFTAVLPKPFRFAALARAVYQVLAESSSSQSGTHRRMDALRQKQN